MVEPLLAGKGDCDLLLLPAMANRHGLVAGATGTGKTVTLQRLAEAFSRIGVPVFLADIKGDLSGLCRAGSPDNVRVAKRVEELGLKESFEYSACPTVFWDVFGEQGHPVRTTISDMGPLLLSRLLDLNEVQSGVLSIAFKVADDNGLLLLDLKDLRAMLQHVGTIAKQLSAEYGNVSPASIGAIQRALLQLEEQGGENFFAEPALNIMDFIQTGEKGRGVINILAADRLLQSPKLYASFLLWMLAELYEQLPEVGDVPKPKIVFFFDEAHLLFNDAPKRLLEKIEQVVRLIRSKGVGIFFVTQNPLDVPDTVLAQLGNRVQHALRAFTPRDRKTVAATAQTFRDNPKLDVETIITQLAVGEALISFLDENGTPGIVEKARVVPPGTQIGPITPEQRKAVIQGSTVFGVYDKLVDRESAYEILKGKVAADDGEKVDADQATKRAEFERKRTEQAETADAKPSKGPQKDGVFMGFVRSAARSMGTAVVGMIKRGLMDTLFRSKKR